MIQHIQKGAFDFITNLLQDYNIRSYFDYDPQLDLLNEFRKNQRFRFENKNSYEDLLKTFSDDAKSTNNFGLFNRTPLKKSTVVGNNTNLEVFVKGYNESGQSTGKVQVRKAFFGEVTFNVKMLFDNCESSDNIEMIYTVHLANQALSYLVDYNFGNGIEPIEEVAYNIMFSEINDIGELGTSNLRFMDFTFTVSGLCFIPYTSEEGLLDRIELRVHAYLPSQKMDPKNTTPETLVLSKDYPMVRN